MACRAHLQPSTRRGSALTALITVKGRFSRDRIVVPHRGPHVVIQWRSTPSGFDILAKKSSPIDRAPGE